MKSPLTAGFNATISRSWISLFETIARVIKATFDGQNEVADLIIKHYRAVVGKQTVTFFDKVNTGDVHNFSDGASAARKKGEPFVLTAIRLVSGAAANVNATTWVPGVATADCINGTFDLSIGGTTVLRGIPLTVFQNAGNESSELGVFTLGRARPIKDAASIVLTATFDVAPATANQNIGFELIGIGQIS